MSSDTNAVQATTPSPDDLRWLLRRYLVLVSQLRLASNDFGDLTGLPQERVAAALVVQDASAELQLLYDRLHEWYVRQNGAPGASVAPVLQAGAAANPRVSLLLDEYALERKINVIRVVREVVAGCSLTKAKALVERALPTPIADGLAPEEAEAMRRRFEAVGAVCRIAVS